MTIDEFLEQLDCACTDGNCIFRPSHWKGMVTNGGCKCLTDRNKHTNVLRYINFLKSKIK